MGLRYPRDDMFGLESPSPYRLKRSPLAQAFAEVRFPIRAALPTLEGVAPIQEMLEPVFPFMNRQDIQQVSLGVGPGGPTADNQFVPTWQFSDDHGWTATIAPNSASVSVGPSYTHFVDFGDRFHTVLAALAENSGVARADRLGVRYVNLAQVAGENDEWRPWFRPELSGWIATPAVGGRTRVVSSITQSHLVCPSSAEGGFEIHAMIRHGLVPANAAVPGVPPIPSTAPAYLLDMDLFVEQPQPFDADRLADITKALHDQIDRFFYWSLSDEGRRHFELEELS